MSIPAASHIAVVLRHAGWSFCTDQDDQLVTIKAEGPHGREIKVTWKASPGCLVIDAPVLWSCKVKCPWKGWVQCLRGLDSIIRYVSTYRINAKEQTP